MKHWLSHVRSAALVFAAVTSLAANAQGLPPLPPSLAHASAVSCIKIDDTGAVSGAFLVTSTGDPARDRDLIAWIKQLHWDAAKPGEKLRNAWFPMPVAFGGEQPPPMPESCAPKLGGGEASHV